MWLWNRTLRDCHPQLLYYNVFPSYTIRKYVHKMKVNKMDWYCGTQVREDRILVEELKRREQIENLGFSGRMM